MDFALNSEYLILAAKWIGGFSFLLIFVITILIIALRIRLVSREKRAGRLHDVWQPVFVSCLDDQVMDFPELVPRDTTTFLVLWNYFHETLREAGKDNLNIIARSLQLDLWAVRALETGTIRERLLAIQTLGWLQENSKNDRLVEIMQTADPITSLCAAKALLRIDPESTINLFVQLIASKTDWSYSTVGKLLKEVGAAIVTEPLLKEIEGKEGRELVRLLRFIDIAFKERSSPTISRLLKTSKDVDVLAHCLRAVVDPGDLSLVRELLKHRDWRIRTQAAICLGQIGTEQDVTPLSHAAGDQDWWVRYRAAMALANIPTVTSERLKSIADNHYNLFGTDIIMKVLQEREAYR